VSVIYDGPAGTLDILVDGELVGSGAASGYTPTTGDYGFYLGAPWGATAEAAVDDLSMTAEPSSIYDGVTGPIDIATDPVLDEPPVVEPPVEEPPVEEPVEEPVVEPVAEDPPQEPVAEEPVEEPVQEPVAEEPVEQPVLQDPVDPVPVVDEETEEETLVTTEPVETEKRGLAKMLDDFMEFIGKIFGKGGGNGKAAKADEVEETASAQSAEIILLSDIMPAVEDTADDFTDDSIGESDLDPMSMSM
ncbi:MAG: LamG domain-containing protein, partial [Alphaproteobacteria bacterium]|nr:LamG domain-containing protein [Alphaproteobacteria bacterium]